VGFLLYGALPPTVHGQAARATKASKGPRALGLLELAPNGKARLIPITIMIDGQYYDAGAYKADPVPMALWSETVYEAIRTGVSQGLFTVTGALQKKDPKNGMEWLAEGTWQSASSIKAKAAKKPVSSVPRGMNDDEGPPVLRRAGSSNPKPTEPAAVPATPPPAQAGPASSPATASAAPPPSSPPAVAPATTPSTPDQAQGDAPPADKDRPELKRGKAGAVSGEEAQKKAAADTSAKTSGSGPAASTTVSSEVPAQAANQTQLIPAISDSHGPDLLPYAYNMRPGEEEEFRKKMLAIAADDVRARAAQLAPKNDSAPQPAHAPAQRSKTTTKPVQPIFENVQLRVFDLGNVNEAELVLTAQAHMPPSSSHTKAAAQQNGDLEYMITLVAREDVNGELRKALVNVTDAQHLDVIPRLDLIDAVDVDGDGRAELLFQEVSDAGSTFVIYRVIGDRLYPLFQGTLG
jgi:hypothetical protein